MNHITVRALLVFAGLPIWATLEVPAEHADLKKLRDRLEVNARVASLELVPSSERPDALIVLDSDEAATEDGRPEGGTRD